MSSICGIVNYKAEYTDFHTLCAMGRSMVLRGRDQSGAYINKGVGLYHNRMLFGDDDKDRQPYSVACGGKTYTVVFDGELYCEDVLTKDYILREHVCPAERVLRAYIRCGYDCLCNLVGAFAFAVLDEAENRLLLAHDATGLKPLYYAVFGETLVFSSEIKGILAYAPGSAKISTEAYRRLLMGEHVRGSDIFIGINELPRGKFAVFSEGGLVLEDYEPMSANLFYPAQKEEAESCAGFGFPKNLSEALGEILCAFDYPHFDTFTLRLNEMLRENGKCKRISYEDGNVTTEPEFAAERADRLGMLHGIMASAVPPASAKQPSPSRRGCRELEKQLRALCENSRDISAPDGEVRRLAGEDIFIALKKEKNISRRINTLGMLFQSHLWLEKYMPVPQ